MSAGRCSIEIVTPEDLLAFEARWAGHSPAKGAAIRRELHIGEARYYQLLHRAALTSDGVRADPITARRVREKLQAAQERRTRRAAPRAAASPT
ncbi:DUF3263 domain-containing protein [Microbacterium maritypicum]